MWEWFRNWGSAGQDYAQYVVTSAGEVYDATTSEIIGYYDETTDTIYNAADQAIDTVTSGITVIYDDAKEGASALLDFGGDALDTVGTTAQGSFGAIRAGAESAQRFANLGFLVVLIPTAAVAYWYFLGRK
tara:strand:- start:1309 stop:1701 length:393 start_codon:yes stop_codon:yes gene_type:complete